MEVPLLSRKVLHLVRDSRGQQSNDKGKQVDTLPPPPPPAPRTHENRGRDNSVVCIHAQLVRQLGAEIAAKKRA